MVFFLSHWSLSTYLGAYLDQSLSFKEHVTRLVNKVSRQLALLSRVRNSLTVHAAERSNLECVHCHAIMIENKIKNHASDKVKKL